MSDGYHLADEAARALFDNPLPESSAPLFTATVTAVSWPTAKIRPTRATTAGDQLIGICRGVVPNVNDRVICAWIGGEPVILAVIASGGPGIYQGSGTPEGAVTAAIGSIYLRSDGASGTTIYTKVTGSGNTGWFAIAGTLNPSLIAPPGLSLDPVNQSAFQTNVTWAIYMGKADRAYTSMKIRVEVMTAAATITWAEMGVGTSDPFGVADSLDITRRGFTNVASTFNTTGEKSVTVSVSGINPGDDLWCLMGSQATTVYRLQAAIGGDLSAGQIQFSLATRISTMAAGKAFSAAGDSAGFYAIMSGS
jgi:hypothetical protein